MYWIYLALFAIIVIIPEIANEDWAFLAEDDREAILIFFVGTIGLLIYLWKERQLRFHVREKIRMQKEASRVSRDLADSYSYIAEINRKMDILKNIALGLPEAGTVTPERMREVHDSLMEALSLLGRTGTYFLCVVDIRTGAIEKQLSAPGKRCPALNFSSLVHRNETVVREGEYSIIRSPKRIRGRVAFVILRKKNGEIEDPEIFKALAVQALFFFSLSEEQKRKK